MVDWAKELGIDLGELMRESPLSGESIRMERKMSKRAADYWAHERFLAQLGDGVEPELPPAPVKRRGPKRKPKYRFTEEQLAIAEKSLARGA